MIRNSPPGIPGHRAIVMLLASNLTGCMFIHTRTLDQGEVTMSEEQFAAYVERVFRHHNKVMNDLINVSEDLSDEGDDGNALSDAEEHMDEACEPLNDVASAEAVSQRASFWTTRKLPDAVPECEAATQRLEVLLREAFKTKKNLDLTDFPDTPE